VSKLGIVIVCLLLAISSVMAFGAEFRGVPRIVDGDTLVVEGFKIRLNGIDAPETDQLCLDQDGKHWACGITARDRLIAKVDGREVKCASSGNDQYGRVLAGCSVAGEDIQKWLVREGLALSFVNYSHLYDPDEAAAKKEKTGMWAGAFIAPWDWRHRNKLTEIKGAYAVPVGSQAELLGSVSAAAAPDPNCSIKGNVNREGERIYHEPGMRGYARTRMDKGNGERWFCSELEAEAAGWRKAMR
jgi:endonuclease YncB( thermonuclease family)